MEDTKPARTQPVAEEWATGLPAMDLLDAIPHVVCATSADQRHLLYLNPSAEIVYGRPRSDFAGNPELWQEVVHCDDRPQLAAALGEFSVHPSFDLNYRIHRPNGEVRWLCDHTQAQFDEDGIPNRIFAIRRDITEQHRAEESFRRNTRLAAIGTLAAGIAHEINNPVGAALLAAENALAIKDRPEQRGLLDLSLRSAIDSLNRCGKIIRNILRFARDEHSEKVLGDLNEIALQARDLTRQFADQKGARIDADLDENLPAVVVSPLEIEQVIINLLHNAVQAGTQGNLVRIQTRHDGKSVSLTVTDNGRGMSEEERHRAFDPFFTTRKDVGGTGLGMSIIFGIVQDHRGSCRIQSELGKGTTITIELPIPQPAQQDSESCMPVAESLLPSDRPSCTEAR